jgi:hypothetical protein
VDVVDEETSPQSSTSLLRDPGSFQDFVKGSTKYVPFLPGGVDKEQKNKKQTKSETLEEYSLEPKSSEGLTKSHSHVSYIHAH